MNKIVIGTTPTIKFVFSRIDPADIVTAILTIKNKSGETVLEKQLYEGNSYSNYISWLFSQEDTISLGKGVFTAMCNWVTIDGIRGVSPEITIKVVPNHIEEVVN